MVRRLFALLLSLALMAVAAAVIGRIVLVPIAEGQVEDAVGRAFAARADADLDPPLGPQLLRGAVGDLRVRLDEVTRGAVRVDDVDVRVIDAHLDVRSVLGGAAEVRFARIAFSGTLTQAVLSAELRRRLIARGVPGGARASVAVTADGVRLRVPGAAPVIVDVRPAPAALAVTARGEGAAGSAVAAAVGGSVRLGRLPYGIRVTKVRTTPGALVVSGGRGAGTETF